MLKCAGSNNVKSIKQVKFWAKFLMQAEADMVPKESGFNLSRAAYLRAECDVFFARLPWQEMAKLFKCTIFVITETQFAIQGQVT